MKNFYIWKVLVEVVCGSSILMGEMMYGAYHSKFWVVGERCAIQHTMYTQHTMLTSTQNDINFMRATKVIYSRLSDIYTTLWYQIKS